MSNQEYNGWTNWETWNVALWIDNEEVLYHQKRRFLNRTLHLSSFRQLFKDWIKQEVFPNGTPDMKSADEMENVNYDEIREHWVEERENEYVDFNIENE